MVTYWRTSPDMQKPAQNERRGPQIYVHVEFGVSWNASPPRRHDITYRSRGLRERSPNFPRRVPAPNTNYLAAIHNFQMQQERDRQTQHNNAYTHQHQSRSHARESRPPAYQEHDRDLRPSRADSRPSSHERGRSAPPPFADNAWDVTVSRPQGGTAFPPAAADVTSLVGPDLMKPQGNPSEFRLFQDGAPWSYSWPYGGFEPIAYPQDDDEEEDGTLGKADERSVRTVPAEGRKRGKSDPWATNVEEVSTFSPISPDDKGKAPSQSQSQSARHRTLVGEDPGRKKELEDLSAALMTVDNGFENQWWNQGDRSATRNPDENDAASTQKRFSQRSVGWAVAEHIPVVVQPEEGRPHEPQEDEWVDDRPVSLDVISPLSGTATLAANSPSPSLFAQLHRSMSTRSEELFFQTPSQRRIGRESENGMF